MNTPSARAQRGAAAIEFAIVFVLFFAVFYAIVSYSLAMLLAQGMTQAAEEGVRAAIAVNPLSFATDAEYDSAVQAQARARIEDALEWLPAKARAQNRIETLVVGNVISVTITYPNYKNNGLVPTLTLPLIGDVPRIPDDLVGKASLQI